MRLHRAAVLTIASLTIAAPAAMGHSGLVASSPKDRATVRVLPRAIVLQFSTPIARPLPARVLRGRVNVALRTRMHPRMRNRVIILTKGNRRVKGVYVVRWRVQHLDAHRTGGVIRFRVR